MKKIILTVALFCSTALNAQVKHLDGFEKTQIFLPDVLTVQDKDILEKINDDGTMIFSIKSNMNADSFYLASIKDQDVHVMNKQSIIRHFERLMNL